MFVDPQGTVVLLVRIKRAFSIEKLGELRNRECPGTIFFVAATGDYTSGSDLQERIAKCARTYSIPPAPAGTERIIDGKRVLDIGFTPDSQRKPRS